MGRGRKSAHSSRKTHGHTLCQDVTVYDVMLIESAVFVSVAAKQHKVSFLRCGDKTTFIHVPFLN